jgi:putative ABC transport system permease protein
MNCFVRASKYLYRKKRKAILLLLLFLVINVMVSGTLAIRISSLRLAEELQKNSEGKVMLESLDRQNGFEEHDLQEIMAIDNINWINRISETRCLPSQLFPVAGNVESEGLFDVHGYDELEKDSPFAEHIYRIVEGNLPQSRDEIVINKYLAEKNGIQMGEEILLQSVEGQTVEAAVTGFFLVGEEERQTDNVATVNRIENQLYATTDFVNMLSGEKDFINAVIYVNNPEQIEDTADILAEMYEGRAVISAKDNTFQKLNMTIGQTERITFLILLLTIMVGCAVAGLLLAMWARGRKKEIAVLISLGVPKGNIFLQMLSEELFLYGLAFIGAQVITVLLLPVVGGRMEYLQENSFMLQLSPGGMIVSLCAGLAGVMILTGISVFPYMKKQVKEVLSEMEG